MRRSRIVTCGASALLVGGLVAAVAVGRVVDNARPRGVAASADFDHPRPNPYFPLRPGTVSRYRGTDDGQRFREVVTVTRRHRTIQGVRTTVVRDVLRRGDGSLAEKTHDWYAADKRGNVWYFGEATATYDRQGHLESREGSWRAGMRGARRGLIMPVRPHATDAYRQEYKAGDAEDQAWVVQRGATVHVPFGTVHHVVRTFEWSRLEPGVVSTKLYGRGLGIVRERDVAGGNETFSLVSVVRHR